MAKSKLNYWIVIIVVIAVIAIVVGQRFGVAPLNETQEEPAGEFYGSSTLGACNTDDDCQVSGCNAEICQSRFEEPRVSICIFPEAPLPEDLGYRCGCFVERCQWVK